MVKRIFHILVFALLGILFGRADGAASVLPADQAWEFKDDGVFSLAQAHGGILYSNAVGNVYSFAQKKLSLQPLHVYRFSARIRMLSPVHGKPYITIYRLNTDGSRQMVADATVAADNAVTDDGSMLIEGMTAHLDADPSEYLLRLHLTPGSTGRLLFTDCSVVDCDAKTVEAMYSSAYRNLAADGEVSFAASYFVDPKAHPEKSLRGMFVFQGPDGRVLRRPATRLARGEARITVSVDDLAMGEQTVVFELSSEKGEMLGCAKCPFTRVAELPRRRVYLDANDRFVVDGKLYFPIGMYWNEVTADELAIYREGPFNCLMPYVYPKSTETLDLCWSNGLMVVYSLMNQYPGYRGTTTGFTDREADAFVREKVAAFGHHPALLAWYLCDEAPPNLVPKIAARRRTLIEADPDHPTWLVLDKPHQVREFMPGFDIVGTDPYPIGNRRGGIDTAGGWTRQTREATFGFRPLWQVPQFFDWSWFRKERTPEMRMPSRVEMRSMVWQMIAEGANGLMGFSFTRLRERCSDRETFDRAWKDICAVLAEVRAREDLILSEPSDVGVTGGKGMVSARAWRQDGGKTLLVVNAARERMDVMVDGRALVLPPLGVVFLNGSSAEAISLDGLWRVKGDGFAGAGRLPGTLAEAGYGIEQSFETWSRLTERREKGALRLKRIYRGKAVWSREFAVPMAYVGKPLEIFLERVLWTSSLKIDGKTIGTCDSLGTPHVYRFAADELEPGLHEIEIEIDNSSHYGFTGKSHGWGWSTQTCWNGVIGRIELRLANPLDGVQVFAPREATALEVRKPGGIAEVSATLDGMTLAGEPTSQGWRFGLPSTPESWSPENPRLHRLALRSGSFTRTLDIGFRTIERRGNRLYLNSVPLWIRGDVDNCQFPETGYPAMGAAEWRRQLRIQKENGINALRFHSWTPPEAAFRAADELGVCLFPETGFWADATIPASNVGHGNAALDDFCRREILAIAATYANHASMLGLSLGNELGKCDFKLMDSWLTEAKRDDGRFLTMVSTARQIASSDDYMVTHLYPGVGPVRCRFREGTDWDYEDVYAKTALPTIAHEIGQWPVYPLWTEIAKYDGLLEPFDWEAMRRTAESNHTLPFNRRYHVASLKTNRFMYKDETEGYLRTPSCSGLQFLDVRDYTGQGEALVGWLDAFFDAKAGLSELPPFSSVLRPVAFLARIPKFVLTDRETLTAELQIRNLSETEIPAGTRYPYSFAGKSGWLVLAKMVAPGEFSERFPVKFHLDGSMTACRQELRFGENRWSVFVMASEGPANVPQGVVLTDDPKRAADALAGGGRVIYTGRSRASVRGRFVPVYWSTVYFPIFNPCAMLGTWFNEDHPALAEFPTEDWMDRQWRRLTDLALVHEPKGLDADFVPIAMPVPDIHLSKLFATMFELRVGSGRLLICGYPIDRTDLPEARQLRKSVFDYVAGESFLPKARVDRTWFADFACKKRPEDLDVGDWRSEAIFDGSLRLTVVKPPPRDGEYTILFAEDGVVEATCEGRPCGTFSAIPVAMVTARITARDAADGRVEFIIRSAGTAALPSVASVSFRIPETAPQL